MTTNSSKLSTSTFAEAIDAVIKLEVEGYKSFKVYRQDAVWFVLTNGVVECTA